MKKTDAKPSDADLLPEYKFNYKNAKPNRFTDRVAVGSRVIVLDPDVAAVFPTPESVNAVLRALIGTMPPTPTTPSRRRKRST